MKTESNRIFGLDIFRAFAIILVVIGHGGFILKSTFLEGFPYFRMIDGVDMFFVLSGFLIGGILLKELNKPEKYNSSDLIKFWKRRWFRTLPNYYLILLLNYLLVKYDIINGNIDNFSLHFITFTHNFTKPFYGFFWESWSLSIEEWFYIFTPILIFILHKFLTNKSAFLVSIVIMVSLPLMYRYRIYTQEIDYFWWDVTFRKTVICRLDSIGYGLFCAWIHYYYSKFWRKIKIPASILGLALIIFITNDESSPNTLFKQTIYFSIIPFTSMLFLPIAESYKNGTGIISICIQHISKISYSMYLINLALVAQIIDKNFTPNGGADSIIKYLLYWFTVILFSTLLYKYFEKPMTDLRDKNLIKHYF
tara:strand:+ start:125 stop:1219 length:1095 start_codon:yes stop_codon:yes gene_type:complete